MIAEKRKRLSLFLVLVGIAATMIVLFVSCVSAIGSATEMAKGTTQTLTTQCKSFENIQSVNRAKALFSMSENLTSLTATFERDPSTVNDEFLEDYVDGMSLSGVAVLDEDLRLVASAYTREYRKENWRDDFYPGLIERMAHSPTQVFAQRIVVDGQYYDVCATGRKDVPGVIIAYYKQPMSLIYDTENDLKQLLKNVRMDSNGEFVIVHNGRLVLEGTRLPNAEAYVAAADKKCSSEKLEILSVGGRHYYGMRVVSEGYKIYLSFPVLSVFKDALTGTAIFALLYVVFCLTGLSFKARAERSKQKALEESNRKIMENAEIMRSLETIYFTVFYVDLRTDSYRSLILAPWIGKYVGESGIFTLAANRLIDASVVERDRPRMKERLDFAQIRNKLKKQADENSLSSSYYTDYEVDREGQNMWCRITLTAVDYDENGEPNHVLVMLQDVDSEKSKEVEYQQKILKESDLARAANRAKSTFLFNVSHDIRTPMNAILGYSELAKKTLSDEEKLSEYLANIQISGERMLSLINEVLEFARIENGKLLLQENAARSGDGIRSCLVIVAPSAKEKDIEINLTANIVHPYVFIDHAHMSRVVLNLLNNAVKYTQRGGKIDCTVNHLPGEDEHSCVIEVVIADNGRGISEEFLPHIFETFERERNSTASGIVGTGLGLGIAKKMVDLMHGTIEVQSEVGKGSVFTVKIPVKIASKEDILKTDITYRIDKESVKNKRILIAEDGDMNAEILTEILSQEGVETARAKDGQECLDMLVAAPDKYYDLVLMDIQMPNTDGLTAARTIRENPDENIANIPIVAMTANAFPEDRKRSIDAGMNAHLSKPIDKKELMLVCEKYLRCKLVCVEYVKKSGGGGISIPNSQGGFEYDDE